MTDNAMAVAVATSIGWLCPEEEGPIKFDMVDMHRTRFDSTVTLEGIHEDGSEWTVLVTIGHIEKRNSWDDTGGER